MDRGSCSKTPGLSVYQAQLLQTTNGPVCDPVKVCPLVQYLYLARIEHAIAPLLEELSELALGSLLRRVGRSRVLAPEWLIEIELSQVHAQTKWQLADMELRARTRNKKTPVWRSDLLAHCPSWRRKAHDRLRLPMMAEHSWNTT